MPLPDTINSAIDRGKKAIQQPVARLWQYVYKAQYRLRRWKCRYGTIAFISFLLLFVTTSYWLPELQNVLESHYATEQSIDGLRSLIQNIGIAMIGATTIATSLVLFAMQVNIERMPHGLFHRLSTDSRLLSAFALAFLLAIVVATLSTFTNQVSLALVVFLASWLTILILVFFVYAYRLALDLINPLQQLDMLIDDTQREFQIWKRRANRNTPLLEPKESTGTTLSSVNSTHDIARTKFFQTNDHWTNDAKKAIQNAMSFTRHYAEKKDYEISKAALDAVVTINKAYIDAKGKTFYDEFLFIDNSLIIDDFINSTLKYLRENIRHGIARRDEKQIEQTLQAMATLVSVYFGIDYSNPDASKSHAHRATKCFTDAVESVVPHNMIAVLSEGQRLMGESVQYLLAHGHPTDLAIVMLTDKITTIALTGCAREDHRPVTREGMMQLADMFLALLRHNHDILSAAKQVRQSVAFIVKSSLKTPETSLAINHNTLLIPYYSSTKSQLMTLVNDISRRESDDEYAQTVIQNIERWSYGIYQTEEELLLEAIKVKSHFTLNIIYWITEVTEILLAVSNAPACHEHSRDTLRKHAYLLIATLARIPDDKEIVTFIQNFQMTKTLYEAANNARQRECDEIAKKIEQILSSWKSKETRYQTGQGIHR